MSPSVESKKILHPNMHPNSLKTEIVNPSVESKKILHPDMHSKRLSTENKPLRIPEWLRRPIQTDKSYAETHSALKKNGLHTVCEDAKCPNRHECWNHGTATIMILGNICTRACRFCSIATLSLIHI